MKKPTLFYLIQGTSIEDLRHDAIAMNLVRRIVLDYLQPGGFTAEEAMEVLIAVVDPDNDSAGLLAAAVGSPGNDNGKDAG